MINFYRKMNNIIRLPGMYKSRVYNLSEHSYQVTLLFEYFAEKENIDITKEAILAVMKHDLVETITDDCPYHVKNFNHKTKEAWDTIETEIVNNQYPFMKDFIDDGENMKGLNKEQFSLMKACDLLELLIFCKEEQEYGNNNKMLLKVIDKCESILYNTKSSLYFKSIICFMEEYFERTV